MKVTTKNALRQIRHQLGSFISIMIIVGVAIGFYATMRVAAETYERVGESHFVNNHLPSILIDGANFTREDEANARSVAGVSTAQVRADTEVKNGEDTLRLYSYDTHNPRISTPYIYEGRTPQNADECLLRRQYADANDISVNNMLTMELGPKSDTCRIVGLATIPENAYLQSSTIIADPVEYGAVYVDTKFAERNQLPFNQIALLITDTDKLDRVISDVTQVIGKDRITNITKHDDIFSYDAFRADVQQFDVFAYVFPVVFFAISVVVIYVTQRRNVLRDRRQIGLMKAMGLSNGQVLMHYLWYVLAVVAGGIVIAVGLSYVAGPALIDAFNRMLDVPGFQFDIPFSHLGLPTLFALVICAVSTVLAVRSAVRIQPAEAMHSEKPARGHDIWLQKTPLWNRLNFNSRYALKAAVRNRGRFVAMVAGMTATMTLVVFSLGFRDAFLNIMATHYGQMSYDISVVASPIPLEYTPFWLSSNVRSYNKALMMPIKLEHAAKTENMSLYISSSPFATRHLVTPAGGQPQVADGVVLPEYVAKRLGVGVGDELRVYTSNKDFDTRLRVTDVTNQMMAFIAVTTYDTARVHGLDRPVYNVVDLRTSGDVEQVRKSIEKADGVVSASSVAKEREGVDRFMGMFMTYVYLLVGFAVLLGIATLYSISSISLLSRQYEFILLRVMGYGRSEILRAYTKELLMQALISIPLGAAIGYYITTRLNESFSTDSMVMNAYIAPKTYLVATAILFAVTSVVIWQAYRQLGRQKLAEGLKYREE